MQQSTFLNGPDRFRLAIEKMPTLLKQLLDARVVAVSARLTIPHSPGLYLFSELSVPTYVGQTRTLRKRYDQHTKERGDHNSASFAFLIARGLAAEAGCTVSLKRADLQVHPEFAPHFMIAKAKVAAMEFRYIINDDPIERSLFEIYAALHLKTEKYNSFETH